MLSMCCVLIEMTISVFTDVGLGFFDFFVLVFVVASDASFCDSEVFCENSDVIFCWRCTGMVKGGLLE